LNLNRMRSSYPRRIDVPSPKYCLDTRLCFPKFNYMPWLCFDRQSILLISEVARDASAACSINPAFRHSVTPLFWLFTVKKQFRLHAISKVSFCDSEAILPTRVFSFRLSPILSCARCFDQIKYDL
jgi:hypothetical protein